MFARKLLSALAFVSVLSAGCAIDATPSTEGEVGTTSSALEAEVGTVLNGYNTRSNLFTTATCVEAKTATLPGTETATVTFSKSESLDSLMTELGIDAEGSVQFGLWNAEGKADFARKAMSSKRGVSYVYKVAYDLDSKVIQDDQPAFSPVARSLVKNPSRFMQVCGDRFVRAENHGARLYVSMRLEFDSEETKTSFETQIGAQTTWGSFSTALKAASNQFKGKMTIQFDAFQEGGDTSGLAGIIGSDHATKCGIDDVASCNALMGDAIKYASTDFRASSKAKPAVTSYETRNYFELPEAEVPAIDDLPGEIVTARRQLANSFQARLGMKSRVEHAQSSKLFDKAAKEAVLEMLQSDYVALTDASKTCYANLQYMPSSTDAKVKVCADTASTIEQKLHSLASLEAAVAQVTPQPFKGKSLARSSGANVCLDDFYGRQSNGSGIGSFACNGGGTQLWNLGVDGKLRLTANPDKCLVTNPDAKNPIAVLWDCNGTAQNAWMIDAKGRLQNDAGNCVNLLGTTGDFAQSTVTTCDDGANQKVVVR